MQQNWQKLDKSDKVQKLTDSFKTIIFKNSNKPYISKNKKIKLQNVEEASYACY